MESTTNPEEGKEFGNKIDGKKIGDEIREELKKQIAELKGIFNLLNYFAYR